MSVKENVWILDISFLIYCWTYANKSKCKCGSKCNVCEFTGFVKLKNSAGNITGGLYGIFQQIINKVKNGHKVIACFDPPREDLTRTKILDTYKASREEKPDFIIWQMNKIKDLLQYIPTVECFTSDKDESDDTMSSIALKFALEGHKVVIESRDKDMFPLLANDNIVIWRDSGFFNKNDFINKFGFQPERFNEFLAITGDTADNFNLFHGLGEKAAIELIGMTSHITEIWKIWEKIPKKYQKKLGKYCEKTGALLEYRKEDLKLSLRLATLNYDANCICINKEGGKSYVKNALEYLEFNSILPHLDLLYGE